MDPITTFTNKMAPLPQENVDTDQITPARFLKAPRKPGTYGETLFHDWRLGDDGQPNPDFVLNQPQYQEAGILLTGDNFGCGSSRETAPWALTDYGFKAVISTSFADIFRNNSLKNGLLPIIVNEDTHQQLFSIVAEDSDAEVTIDLLSKTLTLPDGRKVSFPIDNFFQEMLSKGLDQMGFLLDKVPEIETYEESHLTWANTQP